MPFELRALEAALLTVVKILEHEVAALEGGTHPGTRGWREACTGGCTGGSAIPAHRLGPLPQSWPASGGGWIATTWKRCTTSRTGWPRRWRAWARSRWGGGARGGGGGGGAGMSAPAHTPRGRALRLGLLLLLLHATPRTPACRSPSACNACTLPPPSLQEILEEFLDDEDLMQGVCLSRWAWGVVVGSGGGRSGTQCPASLLPPCHSTRPPTRPPRPQHAPGLTRSRARRAR